MKKKTLDPRSGSGMTEGELLITDEDGRGGASIRNRHFQSVVIIAFTGIQWLVSKMSIDSANEVGTPSLGVRLSTAGSIISLVCAVHCALTPLALLALPLLAAQYGGALEAVVGSVFSPSAEWVFWGVVVVVAGGGVLVTYPLHRDRRPVTLTMAGFLTLLLARLVVGEGSSLELAGDLIGASFIAWGGFVNRSLCRCHPCHARDKKTEDSQPVIVSPGP